jgi:hypothetical protein
MNKYEQLIEHIINENEQAARELFHSIVVEKSREIYESLMDEDQMDENIDQYDSQGGLAHDVAQDETQGLGEEDEEGEEFKLGDDDQADMTDMGGDDMGDMGGDDMGGDDMGGDIGEKFQNVKDIIADLEAEFADLGGDAGAEDGEDEMSGISGSGDVTGEFGGEQDEEGAEEENEAMYEAGNPFAKSGSGVSGSGKSGSGKSGSGKSGSGKSGSGKAMSESELMREYVEKISAPANSEGTPVGTGNKTPRSTTNTKNPVAGKNDMGGSAKNIANGKSDAGDVDGNSTKAKAGGFVKPAQEIDVAKRNVNKVGGNKGAQDFYNTKAKGKTGEGQTTDGSVPVQKRSIEGGK